HTSTHLHTPPHTSTHLHTPPHTSTHLHTPPHTSTHLHTPPHTSTHLHTPPHTSTHLHTPPGYWGVIPTLRDMGGAHSHTHSIPACKRFWRSWWHVLARVADSLSASLRPFHLGHFATPHHTASLASRLISVTLRLPGDALQLLCTWLVSLPWELLGGRVVRPLQQYLSKLAEGGIVGPDGRAEVLAAARVMAGLHAANEKAGGKLPFSEFFNQQLSTHVNLRSEYLLWLEVAGGRSTPPSGSAAAAISQPLMSLCQTPFLLTPEAKSRILQGEAQIQKEAEMSASAREALLQGLHPISAVFLDISVRRASILADTAQQLASRPPHHLKRPLRVSFVSQGVAEEGVDQGGVSREFFQLLVAEIFQPQYGMFTYSEESRTFWFNTSACLEDGAAGEFRLVGLVLGLAIYNGVILDVHFPQAVYKKLLGEPVGLPDFEEAFPTLGRSLRTVLAMDPDQVEDALCRNFEVQYDYFGEQRTVPLIPGGTSIPVTGANRAQYIQRLVEWTLNESVETQFRAFAYGFHQV
ncbi:hypothetical protein Vafri_15644, partial [Volvox africanus]